MRSQDWFESSSPPSTDCSASTEWGGSFSDSTWLSPPVRPEGGKRSWEGTEAMGDCVT